MFFVCDYTELVEKFSVCKCYKQRVFTVSFSIFPCLPDMLCNSFCVLRWFSVIVLLPLFRHRKMRASPIKVSPHHSFDLFNQIAVTACQLPTAFLILAQVLLKKQPFCEDSVLLAPTSIYDVSMPRIQMQKGYQLRQAS